MDLFVRDSERKRILSNLIFLHILALDQKEKYSTQTRKISVAHFIHISLRTSNNDRKKKLIWHVFIVNAIM